MTKQFLVCSFIIFSNSCAMYPGKELNRTIKFLRKVVTSLQEKGLYDRKELHYQDLNPRTGLLPKVLNYLDGEKGLLKNKFLNLYDSKMGSILGRRGIDFVPESQVKIQSLCCACEDFERFLKCYKRCKIIDQMDRLNFLFYDALRDLSESEGIGLNLESSGRLAKWYDKHRLEIADQLSISPNATVDEENFLAGQEISACSWDYSSDCSSDCSSD